MADRIPQPRKQWEETATESVVEHHYPEHEYGQTETKPLEPAHNETTVVDYNLSNDPNTYNYGVTLNMHEEEEE